MRSTNSPPSDGKEESPNSNASLLSDLSITVDLLNRSCFTISAQRRLSEVIHTTQIGLQELKAMGARVSVQTAFKMLQSAVDLSHSAGGRGRGRGREEEQDQSTSLVLTAGYSSHTGEISSKNQSNCLSSVPFDVKSPLILKLCYISPFEEQIFLYELSPETEAEAEETDVLRGMIAELQKEHQKLSELFHRQQNELTSLRASVDAISCNQHLSPSPTERTRLRGRSFSFDDSPRHIPGHHMHSDWTISETANINGSSAEGSCESCSKTSRLKELHVCSKCWGILLNLPHNRKEQKPRAKQLAFEKRIADRRSASLQNKSLTARERSEGVGKTHRSAVNAKGTRGVAEKRVASVGSVYGGRKLAFGGKKGRK